MLLIKWNKLVLTRRTGNMGYLITIMLALIMAGPAMAVDLVCSVPDANVPRGIELCEELRESLGVRPADWGNGKCATEFLRIGMLLGEKTSTTRLYRSTVNVAVRDAVALFGSTWPAIKAAECGDGILDEFIGEECDDGNDVLGDGCELCAIK